jgi:glycerate kinase
VKIICAPDSFKESLSAVAAASAMAKGIRQVTPDAVIDCCPVGDGGEGTLEALLESGAGQFLTTQVTGPLGEITAASFGFGDWIAAHSSKSTRRNENDKFRRWRTTNAGRR